MYASSSSIYGEARALADARGRAAAPVLAVRGDEARRRAPVPALPRQLRRADGVAALLLGLRAAPAPRHGLQPLLPRGRSTASRSRSSATATQTRDFTFVDDVVAADSRRRRRAAARRGASTTSAAAPASSLTHTLDVLEEVSGHRLDRELERREHGDVANTGADISRARADLGFEPATTLEQGLRAEYEWMAERLGSGGRVSARPGVSAPAGPRRAALRALPAEARG